MDEKMTNWVLEEIGRLERILEDTEAGTKEYDNILHELRSLNQLYRENYDLELRIAAANDKIIYEGKEHEMRMKKEELRFENEKKKKRIDVSGDTLVKVGVYAGLTLVCLWFETDHVIHFKNSWNLRNNIR